MKRLELIVHGKVQGTSFRLGAQQAAESLELTGRVRNQDDGTVHIVAEGSESFLKRLAQWAEEGPETAEVDKVDQHWSDGTGEFKDFQIDY